jgi:hypothetical protein
VAVEAGLDGDHHLAAACLLWAFRWSTDLGRRTELGALTQEGPAAIRLDVKVDILAVGIAALTRLPADFVIVGTGADAVEAGSLLDRASRMLEP